MLPVPVIPISSNGNPKLAGQSKGVTVDWNSNTSWLVPSFPVPIHCHVGTTKLCVCVCVCNCHLRLRSNTHLPGSKSSLNQWCLLLHRHVMQAAWRLSTFCSVWAMSFRLHSSICASSQTACHWGAQNEIVLSGILENYSFQKYIKHRFSSTHHMICCNQKKMHKKRAPVLVYRLPGWELGVLK